jgi:hypothetical protein
MNEPADDVQKHLTPRVTGRGFKWLPPIPGEYGGQAEVYESSAASGPHLWLKVQYDDGDATLHLTVENSRLLAEQLTWLADHHYQVAP